MINGITHFARSSFVSQYKKQQRYFRIQLTFGGLPCMSLSPCENNAFNCMKQKKHGVVRRERVRCNTDFCRLLIYCSLRQKRKEKPRTFSLQRHRFGARRAPMDVAFKRDRKKRRAEEDKENRNQGINVISLLHRARSVTGSHDLALGPRGIRQIHLETAETFEEG